MGETSNQLALALGSGGARAAYQVGVLRSVAKHVPELRIPILTGVSAGAINAAFLANQRDTFSDGVQRLAELWSQITVKQIFHANLFALTGNFLRWGVHLLSGGARLLPPIHGLVNTTPLRRFLFDSMKTEDGGLGGIAENLQQGRLKAVGITTTNYGTGQSITWVQGSDCGMWERPLRRSIATKLTVDHVMASCALPLFFPAIQLGNDWHGDGGVRLTAPLSPALHLGAERILAISTRYEKTQTEGEQPLARGYPPPTTVIGLLLNAVFLDMLDFDAAVMHRINQLLSQLPDGHGMDLRPVQLLVIRPSRNLDTLAVDYEKKLPGAFRHFVRGLGTKETDSDPLLATLLIAPEYIRHVMQIGERDGEERRDEIVAFLRGHSALVTH